MKKIIYIVCFLFTASSLLAQTEPMYSQYTFNLLAVNPAYAGNREAVGLNLVKRNQWTGLDGAPQTTSLSLDGRLRNGSVGLGLQLYNDQLGVEKAQGFNVSVSTTVKLSEKAQLSGGLQFGMMNYMANLTDVSNRFTATDVVFAQNYNKWLPSIGMGLYYNTESFYTGISIPDVMLNRLTAFDLVTSGVKNTNNVHLFYVLGNITKLDNETKLKSSLLIKMVAGAPAQYDFNEMVYVKSLIGLGVSYRLEHSFVYMLDLPVTKNLRLGYSYDLSRSDTKLYLQPTHEFMLKYEMAKDKSKIKSTRFF
jgi:type IX secretion system PorP/SprF family membrane protein